MPVRAEQEKVTMPRRLPAPKTVSEEVVGAGSPRARVAGHVGRNAERVHATAEEDSRVLGKLWVLDEQAVAATSAAERDELVRVRRPSCRAVGRVVSDRQCRWLFRVGASGAGGRDDERRESGASEETWRARASRPYACRLAMASVGSCRRRLMLRPGETERHWLCQRLLALHGRPRVGILAPEQEAPTCRIWRYPR
jgi:hypothetical protein